MMIGGFFIYGGATCDSVVHFTILDGAKDG